MNKKIWYGIGSVLLIAIIILGVYGVIKFWEPVVSKIDKVLLLPTPTQNYLLESLATQVAELESRTNKEPVVEVTVVIPAVPTATPTPEIIKTKTSIPTTPTPIPTATPKIVDEQQPEGCPQARDLGPWAPTASGEGLTFEVTASDQGASNLSSAGVVLGLWWPHGQTPWGKKEVTTFIPRGLSITVINGAGRGWDYEQNCSAEIVQAEMQAHMDARKNDTNYYGFVSVEELITHGLIEVRFDRRPGNPTKTPKP